MKKLYFGGLAWATTEESLKETCEQFGTVEEVVIPVHRDTGRSRGFGFVQFQNQEAAEKCKSELDNTELDGRTIRVDWAKERTPRSNMRKFYS
ncbi:MAG: RNA-binding protein [Planctomycetota bacterium]|nr:MAG: RNA-binding protein [Planctomycetota bacterium]